MILSNIVSIIVVLLKAVFYAAVCEGTESGAFFREVLKGRRLENNGLRKVTTRSVVECSSECLREKFCQSVNYGKDSKGTMKHDCELNKGKASTYPELISRDDSYTYYEIMDTRSGFRAEPCSKGSNKNFPGKSCKDIQEHTKSSISKEYWIKPTDNAAPFLVYCEMELYAGGWTLVYSYTFTNYTHFYTSSNAVNPRPNWPAPTANVNISTVPPLKDKFGAIQYYYWGHIGDEFFIRSNINDWYMCKPNVGGLVDKTNGSISCKHVKEISGNCTNTVVPEQIMWEDSGPVLKGRGGVSIYRFDGSTSKWFPTHNSCQAGSKNHKKGVANPYGEIFIK